jgi:hypothetical protein
MPLEPEAPEFGIPEGIPELGIPELLLGDEGPGLGSDGIDDPALALPPDGMLLLLSEPELPELDDDDELLELDDELDDEPPAEPDEPEDDEDGDDGEGIDEGICCWVWQPPIKKAPVAPAAASCSASKHARLTADRWCV